VVEGLEVVVLGAGVVDLRAVNIFDIFLPNMLLLVVVVLEVLGADVVLGF
jgi:cytochrome c oxidase subunit IV